MGRLEAGYTARGTRRRLTVYGLTAAEAKRKLDRKRRQIAREGVSVATATGATVKGWAREWMRTRIHTQRPKGYSADEYAVRTWPGIAAGVPKESFEAVFQAAHRAALLPTPPCSMMPPRSGCSLVRRHENAAARGRAPHSQGAAQDAQRGDPRGS